MESWFFPRQSHLICAKIEDKDSYKKGGMPWPNMSLLWFLVLFCINS